MSPARNDLTISSSLFPERPILVQLRINGLFLNHTVLHGRFPYFEVEVACAFPEVFVGTGPRARPKGVMKTGGRPQVSPLRRFLRLWLTALSEPRGAAQPETRNLQLATRNALREPILFDLRLRNLSRPSFPEPLGRLLPPAGQTVYLNYLAAPLLP